MRSRICAYICDIKELSDNTELFSCLLNSISADGKKRVNRKKTAVTRNQTLAAEYLLKTACADFNIDYDNLQRKENEYGKPYFENCPIFFNISHSFDKVICVLSDCQIGCDIEKIRDFNPKLPNRFFHKKENEIIMETDAKNRNKLFFQIWTLKESYLKYLGCGLKKPLNSFIVNIKDKIEIDDKSDKQYHLISKILEDSYYYAICTGREKETDFRYQYRSIDLEKTEEADKYEIGN